MSHRSIIQTCQEEVSASNSFSHHKCRATTFILFHSLWWSSTRHSLIKNLKVKLISRLRPARQLSSCRKARLMLFGSLSFRLEEKLTDMCATSRREFHFRFSRGGKSTFLWHSPACVGSRLAPFTLHKKS
jgi:hypothetical protein